MSTNGRIGHTVQTPSKVTEMIVEEVTVEWKIKDFSSLSKDEYSSYESPVFRFADSKWCLLLYPDEVLVHLRKVDDGPPKTISCTFGIKRSYGVKEFGMEENEFTNKDDGGLGKCLGSRNELIYGCFMPDDVLTITCRLKRSLLKDTKASKLWEISRHMKKVLTDGKRSDFKLKLRGREWPVHKLILESRSEYFANMFRHDWVKKTEVELTSEDIEVDALDCVLNFVYTGCVEDMSLKNVCKICVAAHEFRLDDLKALCIEYMKGNMCEEIVCRVLVVADRFGEVALRQYAVDYFVRNEGQILHSLEWKKMKKYHGSVAAEILEEAKKKRKAEDRIFLFYFIVISIVVIYIFRGFFLIFEKIPSYIDKYRTASIVH